MVPDQGRPRESLRTTSRDDHVPDRDYAAVAQDLNRSLDGDVRFDEYAQILYATDGSIYQARPAGVVEPRHIADVQATVRVAAEHDIPVVPRGAGSSLAGQAIGAGCIIIDLSTYMTEIESIDPQAKRVTVQPGIVQDRLDDALADYDLKFAPDPASSNRATIGGGIGNNSTGAHSVRYGITDAYTEELRVVLANGELIRTREIVIDSPDYQRIVNADTREAEIYRTVRGLIDEHSAEIERRYPELKRSVSGYNLHKVVAENSEGERVINLSKLFVGSEGTLGVVVEATLSLVSKPDSTALALFCFEELSMALAAVPLALDHPVGAIELMDAEVFRLARDSEGYAEFAAPIPEETAAALMLEWDNELVPASDGAQRERFESAVETARKDFVEEGAAFAVLDAYDDVDQSRLWKLRKAAIPLLMSLEGDPKPYPFIEDATVPPESLADYVDEFVHILDAHDTSAAFFAHAGSGTLHIRPILNLKSESGVEALRSITEEVTDLVLEYDGAFSGEHGDGMARTAFTPKMYGNALWQAFKELKTAFDPKWQMHPGNVVYRSGQSDPGPESDRGVGADNRESLRYGVSYQSIEPQSSLDFDEAGGFAHLVELCNGCGTCRQAETDVMCPTYRASRDEMQTTRGRANLLRAAISGEIEFEALYSEEFQRDVLDRCIACKGCKTDCPTGVDLAKLKVEVKHEYHRRTGVGIRTRVFTDIDRYAALGSQFAPISNWLTQVPGARWALEHIVGIAAERSLPTFRRQSFFDWADAHEPQVSVDKATNRAIFVADPFSTYVDPAPAIAAIRVLDALGVHVEVLPEMPPSGRAAYSVGRLDVARDRADGVVDTVAEYLEQGWELVGVEPADVEMIRDEYGYLLDRDETPVLTERVSGPCEYLQRTGLVKHLEPVHEADGVTLHGHCHQHAAGTDMFAATVLDSIGYDVDFLDSGCCGMAGSFGYEAEHYELSRAIAQDLFSSIERSDRKFVAAPGGSCRAQIRDWEANDRPVVHPIELVERVTSLQDAKQKNR